MAEASAQQSYQPSDKGRTWLIVTIVLAIIGLALSIYSINHHLNAKALGATDAACNINDALSCDAAALSKYSEIAGVPLGVFGLGFFLAQLVLAGLGLAGGKSAREHVQGLVALIGIGFVVSVVLGVISVTQLSAACPTCIGVYAVTILQAIATIVYRQGLPTPLNARLVASGGLTAAIVVALTVAAYSYLPVSKKTDTGVANNTAANLDVPTVAAKAEDIPIARSAYSGFGEDYRKGPDTAPVVIVEFADFQCPACKAASQALDQIYKDYGNKVQVVFRNYPLSNECNASMQQNMHENACEAAILARCAGQFGKFWEMHDLTFANQQSITEANLKTWAKQVGLTDEQIATCLASPDMMNKLKDDVALGNKLGIDSTPTLYINGKKVLGGRDVQSLKAEIDKLL